MISHRDRVARGGDVIQTFVATAQSLAHAAPVTIVFGSAAYAAVLSNWIGFARRAGTRNVLIAALDEEAARIAEVGGAAFARLPEVTSREELWTVRADLFAALTRAGVDFIHSDADAVWLQSPLDEILSLDVDLAFSAGTVWPKSAAEKWGFVVCCGFFAARATPATARFFSSVATRAQRYCDDQIATNEALLAARLKWESGATYQVRVRDGIAFRTFDKTIFGRTSDLSVALLSQQRYPRLPELSSETVVAHPLEPSTEELGFARRSEFLASIGLWEPMDSAPAG